MRSALALPVALLALGACSSDYQHRSRRRRFARDAGVARVRLPEHGGSALLVAERAADAPDRFEHYNIYSTSYDLDRQVCDNNGWGLEGTSVSEDFVVSGLTNGVSLCFAVSSVSLNGNESDVSSYRYDTPRYDARNVLVSTSAVAALDERLPLRVPLVGAARPGRVG